MHSKTTLIGGVGTDPEIIVFENGNKLAKITLATSIYWKDKQSGERKEKTTWHSIQFGGPLAEIVEKYVKKGHRLFVEGVIDNYSYLDKDGNTRYSTQINGDMIKMLTSKNEQQQQQQQQQAPSTPGQPVKPVIPQSDNNAPTGDDDLPF
ncbi:MAG: single-stranded DNA-binding protein [Phycisphaerales bacterium]|nr:single-stranded DNA-binding protein [Phycisphaerales bacterium]